MKRLLLFVILFPVVLSAQPYHWDAGLLPPGAAVVEIPAMKREHLYSRAEYIITNEAQYEALFADSVIPELPPVDFLRYELITTTFCEQCAVSCRGNFSCHRNACRYTRRWFLMDKTNRIAVDADTLNLDRCGYFATYTSGDVCESDSCFERLKTQCDDLKDATVDFKKQTVLSRHMDMDCAARVIQDLYLDTVQHELVWRVSVGYGGCHGMQQRTLVLAVPKLPPGYTVRFEEYTLADKD